MTELEEYYNKFYEERRLDTRHGQVEFITSMKYIHEMIDSIKQENNEKSWDNDAPYKKLEGEQMNSLIKVLDVGAGTGRYSVPLSEAGYDVTAVELVQHNLGILKAKKSKVKAMKGNAMNLSKLADDSFDLTLVFGPMYHLFCMEDKCKVLEEAKRVTKPGGYILVAYVMNEYGVLTYAFKENHIKECMEENRLDESFHTSSSEKDLYDYVRLEDIEALNQTVGMKRVKIISADGPADYLRPILGNMDEETFEMFLRYHLATCERMDLMGACAHTVDILMNIK